MASLSEVVAVAKNVPPVDPAVMTDASTILSQFGGELATDFPKISADIPKAQSVIAFLSKSSAALLAGWDNAIAFLKTLEAAL